MPLLPTLLLALLPGLHTGSDELPKPDGGCLSMAQPGVQHGKLDWFDGTYKELLEKAREEDRIVLLSFYSDTRKHCARLDREAYSDDDVVEALEPVLCLAIDANSESGRVLDALYPTERYYPALIFLDPDGTLRDRMIGYLPVSRFLPELERILRDEGTLGDLRRKVDEKPEDLDRIWAYAQRLDDFGDRTAYAEQVERLHELDPEGTSEPLRALAMEDALAVLHERGDAEPLRKLLAGEKYTELLFLGWSELARHERRQALRADRADRKDASTAHRVAFHQAHLKAWPHVQSEYRAWFGNHVAWDLYKDWAILEQEVRDKGIEIARIVVGLEPGQPEYIDTLACLLFASGEVEEAVELIQRCISLEPENMLWQDRLALFLAKES